MSKPFKVGDVLIYTNKELPHTNRIYSISTTMLEQTQAQKVLRVRHITTYGLIEFEGLTWNYYYKDFMLANEVVLEGGYINVLDSK